MIISIDIDVTKCHSQAGYPCKHMCQIYNVNDENKTFITTQELSAYDLIQNGTFGMLPEFKRYHFYYMKSYLVRFDKQSEFVQFLFECR